MQDAEKTIVSRLFASFEELERAIIAAKRSLAQKSWVSADVVDRVNSYDGILEKQRALAEDLCKHLSAENWDEVGRHIRLINGLSSLIRDDAQGVLKILARRDSAPVEEKVSFSS